MAQIKKDALLKEMASIRRQIVDTASEIPAVLRKESFVGRWNIFDLLAHLAGWDDANRQAVDALRAGQLPDFYQYAERNWETFNDKLVREYRLDFFDEMTARVLETQRQLIAVLEGVPAEDFDRDFNVRFRKYKITISRLMRAELQDEKQHLAQVHQAAALTRGV